MPIVRLFTRSPSNPKHADADADTIHVGGGHHAMPTFTGPRLDDIRTPERLWEGSARPDIAARIAASEPKRMPNYPLGARSDASSTNGAEVGIAVGISLTVHVALKENLAVAALVIVGEQDHRGKTAETEAVGAIATAPVVATSEVTHEASVAFESDLGRTAAQGGGTEAAAHCSLPSSMEASVVGGHVPVLGQSTEAMSFSDESLLNTFGADMASTEVAAAPSLSMAQQADTSTTALPQPGQHPVSTRTSLSLPRPGILASDAWRRMAQNALGIVNFLLTSEPRSMQAGLGLSPLPHGWIQPGQVAIPSDLMSTTPRRTSSVYSDAFDLTTLTQAIIHEQQEQQTHIIAALEWEISQLRCDLRELRVVTDRIRKMLRDMADSATSISQLLMAAQKQCEIERRKRLANFAVI
ncbi:hypothetical protein NQ176_g1713 [Zarea fungicola]|uniref:Uncharacterized protein n=1 Tax=Zarea fungicola TaxID=93591 RepID=A0ACC1NSP0_9HYPO|nr:hypothetical protein NQ176_g1713 [Lecanicillium fungicola]